MSNNVPSLAISICVSRNYMDSVALNVWFPIYLFDRLGKLDKDYWNISYAIWVAGIKNSKKEGS